MTMRKKMAGIGVLFFAFVSYAGADDAEPIAMTQLYLIAEASLTTGRTRVASVHDDSVKDPKNEYLVRSYNFLDKSTIDLQFQHVAGGGNALAGGGNTPPGGGNSGGNAPPAGGNSGGNAPQAGSNSAGNTPPGGGNSGGNTPPGGGNTPPGGINNAPGGINIPGAINNIQGGANNAPGGGNPPNNNSR